MRFDLRSVSLWLGLAVVALFVSFTLLDDTEGDSPLQDCSDPDPKTVEPDEVRLRKAVRESLDRIVPAEPLVRAALPDGGVGLPATRSGLIEHLDSTIGIRFVGTATRTVPPPTEEIVPRNPPPRGDTPSPAVTEWVGFNPETCNQFAIRVPSDTSRMLADFSRERGFDIDQRGSAPRVVPPSVFPWHWIVDFDEQYGPPQEGPYFSGCVDTRIRQKSTAWPNRTVASLSRDGEDTFCTATMVGPRHLLTAAHCVYSYPAQNGGFPSWYEFFVIPGRNGADKPFGESNMTLGGFIWVPFELTTMQKPNWYNGLDIAILVIPDPIGEVTGWMSTLPQNFFQLALQEGNFYHAPFSNRGYPGSNSAGGAIGLHSFQVDGAQYGDIAGCSIGDFSDPDPDGWHRVIGHSCDNSSGHSGGPIYEWLNFLGQAFPNLVGIVSHNSAFVNVFDCENNPYPYRATRLTPEYDQFVTYFINVKP